MSLVAHRAVSKNGLDIKFKEIYWNVNIYKKPRNIQYCEIERIRVNSMY